MKRDYRHLYDVPIEDLGLSNEALETLKSVDLQSIGDCVWFFITAHRNTVSFRFDVGQAMTGEVIDKLIEYDYWAYVEDNWD
jgi:hypothetical protein